MHDCEREWASIADIDDVWRILIARNWRRRNLQPCIIRVPSPSLTPYTKTACKVVQVEWQKEWRRTVTGKGTVTVEREMTWRLDGDICEPDDSASGEWEE